MIRTAVIASVVVVLIALVLVAAACGLQRRLIYQPSGAVPPASERLRNGSEVVLRTSDGVRLGAWFVPARGQGRDVAVLVANGNAGNRAGRAPLADALARRGMDVLLFDYRGYGDSGGTPSEEGLARDARAAMEYLVTQTGTSQERLLYYGESLGAAVATRLAAERPPGGLVLCSPFVDLAAVGSVHYPFLPVRALLRDEFPLIRHLGHVHVPVTVAYGTRDSVVPPEQSRAVADAAPRLADAVTVPGADHNDPALLHGAAMVDAIVAMADRVAAPREPG